MSETVSEYIPPCVASRIIDGPNTTTDSFGQRVCLDLAVRIGKAGGKHLLYKGVCVLDVADALLDTTDPLLTTIRDGVQSLEQEEQVNAA